jgi:hypothetical protein
MMRSPYNQEVFGPFPSQGGDASEIDRQTSNIVDMRGAVDFKNIFAVQSGEYSWGQLLITCDAAASVTVAGATNVENWPHVEIKIVYTINGQQSTFLEAAVGAHTSNTVGNDSESSGPVIVLMEPGEVPDKIEVFARARRGGVAETAGDADEKLNLVVVSRLHK